MLRTNLSGTSCPKRHPYARAKGSQSPRLGSRNCGALWRMFPTQAPNMRSPVQDYNKCFVYPFVCITAWSNIVHLPVVEHIGHKSTIVHSILFPPALAQSKRIASTLVCAGRSTSSPGIPGYPPCLAWVATPLSISPLWFLNLLILISSAAKQRLSTYDAKHRFVHATKPTPGYRSPSLPRTNSCATSLSMRIREAAPNWLGADSMDVAGDYEENVFPEKHAPKAKPA